MSDPKSDPKRDLTTDLGSDTPHYLVTVWEILETTYEVWADNEVLARNVACQESERVDTRRFQTDEKIYPPAVSSVSLVGRRFNC